MKRTDDYNQIVRELFVGKGDRKTVWLTKLVEVKDV